MAKADKTENPNEHELTYKGCYGSRVAYNELADFLDVCFHMNRVAEAKQKTRFSACIYGHAGIGKCVAGDTLISTNKGIIQIQDLFDGIIDEGRYDAPDGLKVSTSMGFQKVEALYYSGFKPSVTIKTNFGRTLTGGLSHRVKVLRADGTEWVLLTDLKIGDTVIVKVEGNSLDSILPSLSRDGRHYNTQFDFSVPSIMNPELATVLGCLVGEGNGTSKVVSFTQDKNKPLAAQFVLSFHRCFGLKLKFYSDKRTKNTGQFSCCRTALRVWLESIGLSFSYSRDKEVPWSILRSSQASQLAFISALCEGEAGNEQQGINISSASKKLLEQVSFMLLQFDVQTSIHEKLVDGTTYYLLSAFGNAGRKLHHLIQFSRAKGSWITAKSNPNIGNIPFEWASSFLKKMRRSHLDNGGNLTKKEVQKTPLNRIYAGPRAPKMVSKGFILDSFPLLGNADKKFKEVFAPMEGWCFEQVMSIVRNEEDIQLYDLCVENSHEFSANGIVSHNTEVVKSFANHPVDFHGVRYEGFQVADVPIAQFEEMGDLHGLPEKHVLMRRLDTSKLDTGGSSLVKNQPMVDQWIPVDLVDNYKRDGWDIDFSAGVRTMYAPPDWVPLKPGPSILLLDDWNRASIRIIKGIMQLLQNYGMVSWKLPAGCNIVLTGNPDEQDYLVTSIDSAILTRIRSVTLVHDAKEWAVWATAEGLDPRGINWVLAYPGIFRVRNGSHLASRRHP